MNTPVMPLWSAAGHNISPSPRTAPDFFDQVIQSNQMFGIEVWLPNAQGNEVMQLVVRRGMKPSSALRVMNMMMNERAWTPSWKPKEALMIL